MLLSVYAKNTLPQFEKHCSNQMKDKYGMFPTFKTFTV